MTASASVFAESAPVFDADMLQMQAENDMQAPDKYPPAPQDQNYVQNTQQAQIEIEQQPIRLSMDQRIQRIEQQLNNIQNGDSVNRVDSLQEQLSALRNQIEEMSHALDQMQNHQRSALAEMNKRINEQATQPVVVASARSDAANVNAVNSAVTSTANRIARNPSIVPAPSQPETPAVATTKTMKAGPAVTDDTVPVVQPPSENQNVAENATQPNVAEEQQIYQTAYNLIKAKKYNDAVKALQGMLEKYPTGQFASNAHYWLGELYGLMGKNDQAMTEFAKVVRTYPDSPRVSDAQLKIGLILAAEFKWSEAKSAFREVINRYPGTASSRLAAEQIKQIKQAGH